MKPAILATMVVCMSLISVPFISTIASADQTEIIVYGPTAVSYNCTVPTYFMGIQIGGVLGPGYAKKLDGVNALMIEGSWYRTRNFTSTDIANYGDDYANRTNFPPNNATIDWVMAIAVAYVNVGTYASVTISLEANLSTVISKNAYITATYPLPLYFPVTDYYDWTPAVLKNQTLISTKLTLTNVQNGDLLAVDYLGLDYKWHYNGTSPPSGPGYNFPGLTLNFSAIFGIVGFMGMIGSLPVAVWYYRQNGGSRIEVAVYALIAFVIFFALFLVGGAG